VIDPLPCWTGPAALRLTANSSSGPTATCRQQDARRFRQLDERRRDELVGSLKTKPGLRRYLRRTGSGLLRVDNAAVKREAHLDGKWLLRTSDTTLASERPRRRLQAAAGRRTRLARHEGRTRAATGVPPPRGPHPTATSNCAGWRCCCCCVVENGTDDTWRNVRHELDRMHLITLATADGQVAQRSATPAGQKAILAALKLRAAAVLRLHRPQRMTGPPRLRSP